jgi:IPT/TIG domain
MADANGNDITTVFVPVTGAVAYTPFGTTIPTPAEGGVLGFVLPVAYKKLGLLTTDGGPEWTTEADGDALEFWQEGYSLPSGLAKCGLKVKVAQYDEIVRHLVTGKTPDANGYITVDAGGSATQWVIYTEEVAKNGRIRRRIAPNATVSSIKQDKNQRGEVNGYEITFKIDRSASVGGEHFGEWMVETDTTPPPYIASVLPSGAAVGADVLVQGNFLGTSGSDISAFTIDGVSVTVKTWISPSLVIATIPAAVSGAAPTVLTTTSGGASNTYAYTAA